MEPADNTLRRLDLLMQTGSLLMENGADTSRTMRNMKRAALIILCIALGVAIPNIFFRRLISPRREQKLMQLLAERRDTAP